MVRARLNIKRPDAMEEYLSANGWHFNKNSVEYAASLMYKKADGRREYIEPYTKDDLRQMLLRYKVEINEEDLWDALYVANMIKADFWGESIEDEEHLVKHIKCVINDADAADGAVFAKWHAAMCMKGVRPDWEDML